MLWKILHCVLGKSSSRLHKPSLTQTPNIHATAFIFISAYAYIHISAAQLSEIIFWWSISFQLIIRYIQKTCCIFSFHIQNWKNGVIASVWDIVLLSLMIHSTFFLPPVREGGAYNLKSVQTNIIILEIFVLYKYIEQRALRNFEFDCKMLPICTKFLTEEGQCPFCNLTEKWF